MELLKGMRKKGIGHRGGKVGVETTQSGGELMNGKRIQEEAGMSEWVTHRRG